jgi:hypothetical protein
VFSPYKILRAAVTSLLFTLLANLLGSCFSSGTAPGAPEPAQVKKLHAGVYPSPKHVTMNGVTIEVPLTDHREDSGQRARRTP